jgi:hypothetical protein
MINRSKRDTDLREEMQFHLAMKQRELERVGFSPEQARDAARRSLGNVTVNREAAHGVWVPPDVESVWRDVPYAIRSLRRSPSFTIAAVLALDRPRPCSACSTVLFCDRCRIASPIGW